MRLCVCVCLSVIDLRRIHGILGADVPTNTHTHMLDGRSNSWETRCSYVTTTTTKGTSMQASARERQRESGWKSYAILSWLPSWTHQIREIQVQHYTYSTLFIITHNTIITYPTYGTYIIHCTTNGFGISLVAECTHGCCLSHERVPVTTCTYKHTHTCATDIPAQPLWWFCVRSAYALSVLFVRYARSYMMRNIEQQQQHPTGHNLNYEMLIHPDSDRLRPTQP